MSQNESIGTESSPLPHWGIGIESAKPLGFVTPVPSIDLTELAVDSDKLSLNSICPSELRKKPSFAEKTRFQGKSLYPK